MKARWLLTALPVLLAAGCRFGAGKPDGSGTIECTQDPMGSIVEVTCVPFLYLKQKSRCLNCAVLA